MRDGKVRTLSSGWPARQINGNLIGPKLLQGQAASWPANAPRHEGVLGSMVGGSPVTMLPAKPPGFKGGGT